MKIFKKIKFNNVLLITILLLGLILRSINLTGNPVGLHQDEALDGYDAYSILYTLKDHHGNNLPLNFESYEDWNPPIIVYITIPFVAVLGLNELSVRLPVVLLGTLSIFLLYLLTKRFTKNNNIALLSAFILAIAPWGITLSRWGVPSNIVPFFGLLVLLSGNIFCENFSNSKKRKIITGLFFIFSAILLTYTYPTMKLFVPLFLVAYCLIVFNFKRNFKTIFIMAVVYTLFVLPIILPALLSPNIYNFRYSMISISRYGSNAITQFILRYIEYFLPTLFLDLVILIYCIMFLNLVIILNF